MFTCICTYANGEWWKYTSCSSHVFCQLLSWKRKQYKCNYSDGLNVCALLWLENPKEPRDVGLYSFASCLNSVNSWHTHWQYFIIVFPIQHLHSWWYRTQINLLLVQPVLATTFSRAKLTNLAYKVSFWTNSWTEGHVSLFYLHIEQSMCLTSWGLSNSMPSRIPPSIQTSFAK